MRVRSGEREDYVLRVIRQAAEALRLLRLRLTDGADAPALVRRQAAVAIDALLGADAPLLARLDAGSAVRLVGDRRRVALWHGLLDVAAAAADAAADPAGADALRVRARALAAAAAAAWGDAADPEPSTGPSGGAGGSADGRGLSDVR
jgi:hypothetical protein